MGAELSIQACMVCGEGEAAANLDDDDEFRVQLNDQPREPDEEPHHTDSQDLHTEHKAIIEQCETADAQREVSDLEGQNKHQDTAGFALYSIPNVSVLHDAEEPEQARAMPTQPAATSYFLGDSRAIVLDNGAGVFKAGFAGDSLPCSMFTTVAGLPRHPDTITDSCKDSFVGEEALLHSYALELWYPIKQGRVINWDIMEKIWNHVFTHELRVNPEEHNVLLTDAPVGPKANRTQMSEVMFESFSVPGMFVSMPAMLSLFASGRTTGCVLDSGHDTSHVVCIHDGDIPNYNAILNPLVPLDFGGSHLTEYMQNMLMERGYDLQSHAQQSMVCDMKETLSYVSIDFDRDMQNSETDYYDLPDGTRIALGSERFRCTEALFRPYLISVESSGVHECIYQSISRCDADLRKDMFASIVLSGGNTMFKGLAERLTKELGSFQRHHSWRIKVVAPAERKLSAWMGGAFLATHSTFQSMWVSKAEYEEFGSSIIIRKCPY